MAGSRGRAGTAGTDDVGAGTVIKIGFLIDWGLRSPLYPAAAASAIGSASKALEKSGVLGQGIRVEWVWDDSGCDPVRGYAAAERLLDRYKVDMIVGSACCASAARASVLAEQRGVPLISTACSADSLSDKAVYPSFLRVVGPDADFARSLGALFERHRWAGASFIFAGGRSRGLAFNSLALEMRKELEQRGRTVGAWREFDGAESCEVPAGEGLSVRAAVDAAAVSAGGENVIVVLGECADYRQVMTYAASQGLVSSARAWILLSAARDPACHVSARTCNRDDGSDLTALESMRGAVSIDWAPMPTARENAALYAEAMAAYTRDEFASECLPPPSGTACWSTNVSPDSPPSWYKSASNAADSRETGGGSDDARGKRATDNIVAAAVAEQRVEGTGIAGEGSECYDNACVGSSREEYHPVAGAAPPGVLRASSLLHDAVELGGRALAAAAAAGGDGHGGVAAMSGQGRGRAGVDWAAVALGLRFEGVSGLVELDDRGNRLGMDVSFWQLDGRTLEGVSYVQGIEAARYSSATRKVQLLREVEWPPGVATFPSTSQRALSSGQASFGGEEGTKVDHPFGESGRAYRRGLREFDELVASGRSESGDGVLTSAAPPGETLVGLSRAQDGEPQRPETVPGGDGVSDVLGASLASQWRDTPREDERIALSTRRTLDVTIGNVGGPITAASAGPLRIDGGDTSARLHAEPWGVDPATGERSPPLLGQQTPEPDHRLQQHQHQQRKQTRERVQNSRPRPVASEASRPRQDPSIDGEGGLLAGADLGGRDEGGNSHSPVETPPSCRAGKTMPTAAAAGASSPPSPAVSAGLSRPGVHSVEPALADGDRPAGGYGSSAGKDPASGRGHDSTSSSRGSPPNGYRSDADRRHTRGGSDGSSSRQQRRQRQGGVGTSPSASPQPQHYRRDEQQQEQHHQQHHERERQHLQQQQQQQQQQRRQSLQQQQEAAAEITMPAETASKAATTQTTTTATSPVPRLDVIPGSNTSTLFDRTYDGTQDAPGGASASFPELQASTVVNGKDSRGPDQQAIKGSGFFPLTPDEAAPQDSSEGGEGGGGGAVTGKLGDNYSYAAFTPMSEERLRIMDDELQQISDHAMRALDEVEVDADDLAIGEIVGSGSFAAVRKGRVILRARNNVDPTEKGGEPPRASKTSLTLSKRASPDVLSGKADVALKVIRDVSRNSLKRFWFEVLIMKDLDHPNIVRLLGATWRGRRLMMIVDYVERGNLAMVLEEGPTLTWKRQKFNMCLDIAKGMAYLHRYRYFDELSNTFQNCVIHRDLKPQNLLVTEDFRVKITDFGEATGKGDGDDAARTQVGTLLYIAPEIVRGEMYDERCDVYSFAVVLLAMLQLRQDVIMLFGEELSRREVGKTVHRSRFTHMAITNSIVNENLRPTLPSTVYETLSILIQQCWDPAPALRPTFDEILEFLETIARDEIVEGQPLQDDRTVDLEAETPTSDVVAAAALKSPSPSASLAGSSPMYSAHHQDAVGTSPMSFSNHFSGAAVVDGIAGGGIGVGAYSVGVDSSDGGDAEDVELGQAAGASESSQKKNAARQAPTRSGGVPVYQDEAIGGGIKQLAFTTGKKRGKNYRPVKGNMGLEFLEKHKELRKADAPYTILEEDSEDDKASIESPRYSATAAAAAAAAAAAGSPAYLSAATVAPIPIGTKTGEVGTATPSGAPGAGGEALPSADLLRSSHREQGKGAGSVGNRNVEPEGWGWDRTPMTEVLLATPHHVDDYERSATVHDASDPAGSGSAEVGGSREGGLEEGGSTEGAGEEGGGKGGGEFSPLILRRSRSRGGSGSSNSSNCYGQYRVIGRLDHGRANAADEGASRMKSDASAATEGEYSVRSASDSSPESGKNVMHARSWSGSLPQMWEDGANAGGLRDRLTADKGSHSGIGYQQILSSPARKAAAPWVPARLRSPRASAQAGGSGDGEDLMPVDGRALSSGFAADDSAHNRCGSAQSKVSADCDGSCRTDVSGTSEHGHDFTTFINTNQSAASVQTSANLRISTYPTNASSCLEPSGRGSSGTPSPDSIGDLAPSTEGDATESAASSSAASGASTLTPERNIPEFPEDVGPQPDFDGPPSARPIKDVPAVIGDEPAGHELRKDQDSHNLGVCGEVRGGGGEGAGEANVCG